MSFDKDDRDRPTVALTVARSEARSAHYFLVITLVDLERTVGLRRDPLAAAREHLVAKALTLDGRHL
jgi:hypothetical protein